MVESIDKMKNMLIGALVTGVADAALEGYSVYMGAQGKDLSGQFPYMIIPQAPFIPPLDDWIACAGVPALLYGLAHFTKKKSLRSMAKGGAIYGISTLVGETMVRATWQMQGKIKPASATYTYIAR
jgi:hypothetical protein